MKILVDLLYIQDDSYTGIGKVALDLVNGFLEFSELDLSLLIWEGQESMYDKRISRVIKTICLPIVYQKLINKRPLKKCPKWLETRIKDFAFDCVFSPRLTSKSFYYPRDIKQVAVVHDLQHLKILISRRKWLPYIYNLIVTNIYYRRPVCLVAISFFTQKEIYKYTKQSSVVIYNSVHPPINNDNVSNEIVDLHKTEYILDVNTFWKYKNADRLIEAFSKVVDDIPHVLYLKGNSKDAVRAEELKKYVHDKGLENRVIIDIKNRSDEDMAYLFRNASIFISPSLMEGFGLTPIEAAINKIPLAVSNIETLVEVTDNKVRTFNPKSIEEMSQTILDLANNPPSAERLNQLSEYFAEKYSQKNQVDSYVSLFNTVLLK